MNGYDVYPSGACNVGFGGGAASLTGCGSGSWRSMYFFMIDGLPLRFFSIFPPSLAVSEIQASEPRGFIGAAEIHVACFGPPGDGSRSPRSSTAGQDGTPRAPSRSPASEIKIAQHAFHDYRKFRSRRRSDELHGLPMIVLLHHRFVAVGVAFRGIHGLGEILVDLLAQTVRRFKPNLASVQFLPQQAVGVRHHLRVDFAAHAAI